MQVDPKKSRQAHSQIGSLSPAAASSPQPDSQTSRCDPRGPQLAFRRGGNASQPFFAEELQRPFFADPPFHPASWRAIAFWCVVAALLALLMFWIDDHGQALVGQWTEWAW